MITPGSEGTTCKVGPAHTHILCLADIPEHPLVLQVPATAISPTGHKKNLISEEEKYPKMYHL